jgi:glycosyltransferase involved in cell wall biosynthesis
LALASKNEKQSINQKNVRYHAAKGVMRMGEIAMNQPKRICFLSCSAHPLHQSGVATWIDTMAKALAKRGHEVVVFTTEWNPKKRMFKQYIYYMDGYRVVSVNYPIKIKDYYDFYRDDNVINMSLEASFQSFLITVEPDIVHAHAIQGLGANLLEIAKEAGCKTVLSVHDWWLLCPNMFVMDCFGKPCDESMATEAVCGDCLEKIMRIEGSERLLPEFDGRVFWKRRTGYLKWVVATHVDCLLPVSETINQFLVDNQVTAKQSHVFESGITTIKPKTESKKEDRTITFGYVGGVVQAKGVWILLEALSKVHSVNWRLFFYGVKKNEMNEELKKQLDKHSNIAQNIYLCGTFNESQKASVYGEIDCLIIPSVCQESYSLAAREALSQGVPVLSSACGGAEEVISHGENGWIVPRNNVAALTKQIDDLLENCDQIQKVKKQALNTKIVYSENQMSELEAMYDQLIKDEESHDEKNH